MADFCGIGTSIPSTDDGDMFSKVELELRKKYDRRGYSDATSNKNWKLELELKKPAEVVRGQDVNLMFTESWQQYSDTDVSTFLRCNEGKELLTYCGKRASGISNSSDDTGSSSHSDETEFQRADSTTSDFFSFSGSDHTFDNRSDVESPSPGSRNQFAPGLSCPHLWFTTCNHCGATADSAHSSDFCPVVKMSKLNIKPE
ncbi:unnamed protein product [Heligmosomoides polygyrus]|uniref:Nanos-type domain-containing protein n=1 Tax=Heligmosomoides polygyrus TaxID=6339 RepID=A0A183FH44_HELPZ|nr:unnamed protein product [Heligmosomoides polygyrus]